MQQQIGDLDTLLHYVTYCSWVKSTERHRLRALNDISRLAASGFLFHILMADSHYHFGFAVSSDYSDVNIIREIIRAFEAMQEVVFFLLL